MSFDNNVDSFKCSETAKVCFMYFCNSCLNQRISLTLCKQFAACLSFVFASFERKNNVKILYLNEGGL